MYIHVNTENVVIDVTENARYVEKNPKSGVIVATTDKSKAIGAIGRDDIIRQFAAVIICPNWNTLSDVIPVQELPEDFELGKYVYSDGEFSPYEGIAELSGKELTEKTMVNEEDISSNREGIMETYEETAVNTEDIAGLREATMELYEMIIGEGE